jgi:hypothetical protein
MMRLRQGSLMKNWRKKNYCLHPKQYASPVTHCTPKNVDFQAQSDSEMDKKDSSEIFEKQNQNAPQIT